LNQSGRFFQSYGIQPRDRNCLSDNIIWSVYEDRNGDLWIGTDTGGLNRYQPGRDRFTFFEHDSTNPNSLQSNSVLAIKEDKKGNLWIGTFDGGLSVLDPKRQQFKHYQHDENDPSRLASNSITTIYVDSFDDIWIGTNVGVVNKFDPDKKFVKYHLVDSSAGRATQKYNEIWTILEDRSDRFWIGTEKEGLFLLNRDDGAVINYRHHQHIPNSLSNNCVLSLAEDRNGTLWIGTHGGGLNKFDDEKQIFTSYTTDHGLPNNVIYGILEEDASTEDDNIILWLSTNKGLSKFDTQSLSFTNYQSTDGFPSSEFNAGAYFKSTGGEMFFGSIEGLVRFNPKNIPIDSYAPPVVFTDFKIFNKSIPVGQDEQGRIILSKSISETDHVKLSHRENSFGIEFAMLNFAGVGTNRYQYKMKGLDDKWINVGAANYVNYNRLRPGKYEFKVKAVNHHNVWSDQETTLKITINPPYWQTLWYKILFYGAIAMVLGLIFYVIVKIYRNRNKQLKEWNQRLTEQIEERKKAEEKLATSLEEKSVLLKEIHHRVKNNLQTIISLLYLQSKRVNDKQAIESFQESTRRIYSMALVHEKLYHTENLSQINFGDYIKTMVKKLLEASEVNTRVDVEFDLQKITLGIDNAIPLGLIVNELITNALKHAYPNREKGSLVVGFRRRLDHNLELVIKDDGIGLPQDFRFQNSDSLGFRLVNILTDQLEGRVSVDSTSGTTVTISFSKSPADDS